MASAHSTAFTSLKSLSRAIPAVSALALSLSAGLWMLHGQPNAPSEVAGAPKATSGTTPVAFPYGPMLVDMGARARMASTAQTARVEAKVETSPQTPAAVPEQQQAATTAVVEGEVAPLPPRRPSELRYSASRSPVRVPLRQAALQNAPAAPAAAPADNRSIFEKFFGASTPASPQAAQAPGQALSYAPAETGLFGGTKPATAPAPVSPSTGGADRYTAIYDISAHTVYMPNGTKLEAHSGLGSRLDDPRYVHERMHGPTPPHVYSLSPREALFHGVEALRLTPIGGGNIFGRAGLLAHTYMLGPNGDSNGCVSFRNYDAFLQAYKRGEVKRLVVVAHM